MLVKNIIKTSAEYLDLKNIIKYLDGEIEKNDEIENDLNNLMLAVNMVNNNVASSYIELISQKRINIVSSITKYSDISNKAIIEIKNVVSSSGRKLNFKTMPEGIKLDYIGSCDIEFSYFPEKLIIDDEIDYYLKLNEITFAMGVVGEFLYIKGVIDDAYKWDKRFKNNLFNLLRPKRSIVMPARRWWYYVLF